MVDSVAERGDLVVLDVVAVQVVRLQPPDGRPKRPAGVADGPVRAERRDEHVFEGERDVGRDCTRRPAGRGNRVLVDRFEATVFALAESQVERLLSERCSDDPRMVCSFDVLCELVGVDRTDLSEVVRGVSERRSVYHRDGVTVGYRVE